MSKASVSEDLGMTSALRARSARTDNAKSIAR